MIINNNLSAMFANRQLGNLQGGIDSNMERLSSGVRINRAADDASGLAVSEGMRSQIRGLNQAERNIMNGVSFIQTAEGFLQGSQNVLHRVRELSVQAANGIYTESDRMMIQVEVSQLVSEIDRIANHAQFNGMNMLTGSFSANGGAGPMVLHVGANMDQRESIFIGDMTASALGVRNAQDGQAVSLMSADQANQTLGIVDSALTMVSQQRADLGAYQNRFEMAAQSVAIAAENTQASESRIRDTNMASEMVKYTRGSILNQAAISMLAQANVRPQSVLRLLG
jgi:flagellin